MKKRRWSRNEAKEDKVDEEEGKKVDKEEVKEED